MLAMLAALLSACSTIIQGSAVAGSEVAAPAPVTEAWKRDVTSAVATIGAALGTAGQAMIDGRYTQVRQGCTDLEDATDQLADQLPSADDDVDAALQDAVDQYREFAQVCMTLTPTSSGAEIDRLEALLDRADGSVREALMLLGIDLPPR